MASGKAVCKIRSSRCGTCTVSNPAPLRRHARAANNAAPIFPRLPAISNACPNIPLCAKRGRGRNTSSKSFSPISANGVNVPSIASGCNRISNTFHLPTYSAFPPAEKLTSGNRTRKSSLPAQSHPGHSAGCLRQTTRRNIDRNDRRFRLVDILHQCGKPAGQRTIQPGTEQTVNQNDLLIQIRHAEIARRHLHKVFSARQLKQPFRFCSQSGESREVGLNR